MRVSAHVLIKRDGQCCQFVPFQKRAWHAGVSQWHGRTACNDFSIGIELEGADHDTYTAQQYQMLNELIDALRKTYPSLSEAPIVGHSDIAPGRKTDPGPLFDWNQVFRRSKA
jgi:AmpD protein